MTNSRMTDPEVLEQKFPVFVESFAIRRGSGGDGRWRGGDGAVRRLRFRDTVDVSVLSGHRRVPPFGLAGGGPGRTGANRVERADGRQETLAGTATTRLGPGDCLVIETPGGGGYGTPGGGDGTPAGGTERPAAATERSCRSASRAMPRQRTVASRAMRAPTSRAFMRSARSGAGMRCSSRGSRPRSGGGSA
jgi:N-methylhydantoinase B/oxoprolinase/acetone carboxylase alpha subunit